MPYTPPDRLAFWASRLPYVGGVFQPYSADVPYYLDGGEHYDPTLGFYHAEDLSKALDLEVTDWTPQIAASLVQYRDKAVLGSEGGAETPGVPPWHVFLSGIARHYEETLDPLDIQAADILLGSTGAHYSDESLRENYGHVGTQREVAEMLQMLLDRQTMGLDEHVNTDAAAECCLGLIDQWVEPPETKHYGVWLKPFMGGLLARALLTYWTRYREATGTRGAIVARIPDAMKAFCGYLWSDCWIPSDGSWPHGAIRYLDIAFADPRLAPIGPGLEITAVGPDLRRTFRGPTSLSDVDDHYVGAIITIDGIADYFGCKAYDGATREFTVMSSYTISRDLTTADTFGLQPNPPNRDTTEGNGGAPDLNHLLFPAFAWCYWHDRVVTEDTSAAATWRERAHAVFNGCYQSWNDAYQQKQWNQSNYWTVDGLGWLELGDTASNGTDPGPGTDPDPDPCPCPCPDEDDMPTPLEAVNLAILETLAGPKSASGDAGSVEAHSLKDLLALRDALSAGAAGTTTRKNRGLRFSRFLPDGATGGPIR